MPHLVFRKSEITFHLSRHRFFQQQNHKVHNIGNTQSYAEQVFFALDSPPILITYKINMFTMYYTNPIQFLQREIKQTFAFIASSQDHLFICQWFSIHQYKKEPS